MCNVLHLLYIRVFCIYTHSIHIYTTTHSYSYLTGQSYGSSTELKIRQHLASELGKNCVWRKCWCQSWHSLLQHPSHSKWCTKDKTSIADGHCQWRMARLVQALVTTLYQWGDQKSQYIQSRGQRFALMQWAQAHQKLNSWRLKKPFWNLVPCAWIHGPRVCRGVFVAVQYDPVEFLSCGINHHLLLHNLSHMSTMFRNTVDVSSPPEINWFLVEMSRSKPNRRAGVRLRRYKGLHCKQTSFLDVDAWMHVKLCTQGVKMVGKTKQRRRQDDVLKQKEKFIKIRNKQERV